MALPESGKFLSTNGLTELIRLIKTEDNKKLENVKLNGDALLITDHSVNITNATPSTSGEGGKAGLLSAQDKEVIDGLKEGAISELQIDGATIPKKSGTTIVDIPLATASEVGSTGNDGAMSVEQATKLNEIEEKAQVNAIETITLADAATTIDNKNVNIPLASTSENGLLSKEDKAKLDSTVQGVKFNGAELTKDGDKKVSFTVKRNGTTISPTAGAIDISVPIEKVKQNGTELAIDQSDNSVNVLADQNIIESVAIGSTTLEPANKKVTIPLASSNTNGAMASTDKAKLDTIDEDADVNVIEGVSYNGTDLSISNKKALLTAETSISDTTDDDGKLATIGAIKTWTSQHAKIEAVKQNGVELPIDEKAVDVTVPYMELYQTIDGTTQTKIIPSEGKGVINFSGLVPKTDIQSDFSQAISDTNKVAQAKAIKEYVDSKAHLSFQILTTKTTDDIYYSKDSSGNITIHVKDGVTPSTSTIFLVPESGSYGSYIEYFYDATTRKFEEFGRTTIDLSAYAKYTDFTTFSATEIDTLWEAQ